MLFRSHFVDMVLVKLADRVVDRYFVQSSEELEEFPKLWGVSKAKMRRCLYFTSIKNSDISEPEPPPGDHIFAGGNGHRDYDTLIEVARKMPYQKFVFATRRLDDVQNLPENISARQVPHTEFVRLMRSSIAVVIPIKKGLSRAAGQQSYLNAMLLRKPCIVNEGFGVQDHIVNGENAIVVDGSVDSYLQALNWVLDPQNSESISKMCAAAQIVSEKFSRLNHLRNAVDLVREMVERSQGL